LSHLFWVQNRGFFRGCCSSLFRCSRHRVSSCPASSSVSSDPLGDGGSGVVGLGALSSIKALSSPSPRDNRLRFSAKGSMSFSLFVLILSVC